MRAGVCQLLLVIHFLTFAAIGEAADKEPEICMDCHQYPGLARQTKSGKLKLLHIDAKRYRASSHGDLSCRDCHRDVDNIPHTGANKIDCQSRCHQSPKEQRRLKKTPRRGFHKKEQSAIVALEDHTSCKVCHAIYPHQSKPAVRAFLNMHTGYLFCEVCHLDRSKFDIVNYDWVTTDKVRFRGVPFTTRYLPAQKRSTKPASGLPRIAPFVHRTGEVSLPLINTWDTTDAQTVWAARKQLGKSKLQKKIRYYHRDMVKMNYLSICGKCHAKEGLLDFRALGFSKKNAESLKSMPISNIIKDYDVFYLPKMKGM